MVRGYSFTATFLLVLFGHILHECYGAKSRRSAHDDSKDTKVLVLGAGMAGMSAATALIEAGYHNVQILEGTDRIGGRVKEAKLGDFIVELGSMWVYGKGSNPIYHMANKFNISLTDNYFDAWTVRDSAGQNLTERADELYDEFDEILIKIRDFAKMSDKDVNLAGALRYFNWTSNANLEKVIEAFFLDFEIGVLPNAHSGKYVYLKETFEDFGSFDTLVSKHENGLVNLIERMSENINASDENRVLLNTVVTEIEYDDDSVLVHTLDGQTFEADFAIVTFSLGVLQHRKVEFNPPLPEQKQFAVDTFGFTPYTQIYLRFNEAFWDDTMYILHAGPFRSKNAFFVNMNAIYTGSNILQISLMDTVADWVENTDESDVISEIVDTLEKMYPNSIIPNPIDYVISRWNEDPFTYGAWSYWPPSFTKEDMQNLIAPVGRLHFAGEYAHELHYSFLHAAHLSGDGVAKKIIQCIEDPDTCSTVQDWKDRSQDVVQCTSGSVGGFIISAGSFLVSSVLVIKNMYSFY